MTTPRDTLDALLADLIESVYTSTGTDVIRQKIRAHFAASAQTAAGDGWQRMTEAVRDLQRRHIDNHQGDVYHAMQSLAVKFGAPRTGPMFQDAPAQQPAALIPCPTEGCVYVAGHLCACRTEPTEAVAQSAPLPAAQSDGMAAFDAALANFAATISDYSHPDGDVITEQDANDARQTLRTLYADAIAALRQQSPANRTFQARVAPWMQTCFGAAIASDVRERGDRLLEEVLELLQSHGYDRTRVATLCDYVYGRPVGEPAQEVGGVMVTLAAYCLATGLDMHAAGDTELARINVPAVIEKIRTKQASKRGLHTPLPTAEPANRTAMPEGARAIIEAATRIERKAITVSHVKSTIFTRDLDALRKALAAYDPAKAVGLQAEVDRLTAIINTPHADDFLRAVSIEAEHQRQRWGSSHDGGKMPADWFWLLGYLAGKALHAHAAGDSSKAEHHVITTAAACANWHAAMLGKTDMRPGIDPAAHSIPVVPDGGKEAAL